jgi:hypothetical protein
MHRICVFVAAAAAVAVGVIGLRWGTYAAGGSDSSCYALLAEAFASGAMQPTSDLVARVPWPGAQATFTPGGFVMSEHNPSASAPVCAPGFSLLLAPLIAIGGRDGMFMLTPAAGALLVWLTFVAGRTIAGPLAGAMAAVLVAASPVMLYQVVQPMNDVTTAALWMGVFTALIRRRFALAGLVCGLALLVRPNLVPLGLVAALFVILGRPKSPISGLAAFVLAATPFGLLVLWLNNGLYGSPLRTGYGDLGHLFSISAFSGNAVRYFGWLIETHTPYPLLAFAAPLVVAREKRADVALAIGLIAATSVIYFFYTPFDDWSFLRFLLPAIVLMVVLASAVTIQCVQYVVSGFGRTAIVGFITIALTLFYVRTAEDRLVFNMKYLEQRYRSAGIVVRDKLPENAVILSVWDSGAVRFHGRREALVWAGLNPGWLDRSLDWLDAQGRTPYILLESWEEPQFRSRFANHSDIGKLDWPPKYEIDRVVRIFDPKDRQRYHNGEHVSTEYLWPLKD